MEKIIIHKFKEGEDINIKDDIKTLNDAFTMRVDINDFFERVLKPLGDKKMAIYTQKMYDEIKEAYIEYFQDYFTL